MKSRLRTAFSLEYCFSERDDPRFPEHNSVQIDFSSIGTISLRCSLQQLQDPPKEMDNPVPIQNQSSWLPSGAYSRDHGYTCSAIIAIQEPIV